jgi:hypothetical protein
VTRATPIFGISAGALGFAMRGTLPWTLAIFALRALVLLAGVGRATGCTLVGTVGCIGLPAMSLFVYTAAYDHGKFLSVVVIARILFLPLFGLSFMGGGLRR